MHLLPPPCASPPATSYLSRLLSHHRLNYEILNLVPSAGAFVQSLLMDNIDNAHAESTSDAQSPDSVLPPPSLPRRFEKAGLGYRTSSSDDTKPSTSVDHLVIVVHGAGTCKETAESHGVELQVRCEVCCVPFKNQ